MTAPRRLQLRRGNSASITSYTGAAGEVVINTTDWTLRVHDGVTAGGYAVASTGNVTQANLGMLGYVNQANTIQSQQISAANLGMKGYVDSVASPFYYGNINVQAYTESMGFQNFSNVNVAAYVTTANSAIIGYIDLANTIQSNQLTSANLGMKGYVDNQITNLIGGAPSILDTLNEIAESINDDANVYTSLVNSIASANVALKGYIDLANTIQSSQVGAANLAITAANLGMKGYVDSVASQSIYGNANVKSYLTQFDGDIIPSANVTYSLGNVTNRWQDLYLSGNTIFLGDATITTDGGRLVTTGAVISPPTGAVGFANVYYESPTDFAQIRSYYVDNNFGYTANLKSWTTAPIVWDSLRSAKIYHASLEFPDFDPLDTVGGRYANAVCTLDATGNIASLTITDGGIGYDAYYPYYATDPTGYVYNSIGRSDAGAPQGIGFRRIDLVPTTASDIGNVAYLIRTGGSGGPTITRGPAAPTVGSNTYTWTGNSGSTFSITIDWTANTSTSFSYTPALPPLTSAQEWQDWLLDYQAAYAGPTTDPLYPDYSAEAYLRLEAYPSILIYDITNAIWFLNVENPAFWQTLPGLPVNLSDNYFRVMIGGPALGYATLESGYGVPVYWSRGLSADTGISSGGDMTVAGDLRVSGDLYVSPTSIYMGDLRISAADGNLKVNTGIKFSDNSVQSTAYTGNLDISGKYINFSASPATGSDRIIFSNGSEQTVAYTGYGNTQMGAYANLANYAWSANVTAANVGMKGYVDSAVSTANIGIIGYIGLGNTIQSAQIVSANLGMKGYVDSLTYSNIQVASYLTTNPQPGTYSNVQVENYLLTGVTAITVGNIAGNTSGYTIGYLDIPQVAAGNVTLALSDRGKHYYATASAPTTLTIPSNANVAFQTGTAITIVNKGTGTITVAKQVEASLYMAGNSTSAARTISSYGMATLLKTATNEWFINGTGVA